MVDAICRVKSKEQLSEDFIIRVKHREEAEELLAYLRKQGVACELGNIKEEGEDLLVEIKRMKFTSRDKIKAVLKGKE